LHLPDGLVEVLEDRGAPEPVDPCPGGTFDLQQGDRKLGIARQIPARDHDRAGRHHTGISSHDIPRCPMAQAATLAWIESTEPAGTTISPATSSLTMTDVPDVVAGTEKNGRTATGVLARVAAEKTCTAEGAEVFDSRLLRMVKAVVAVGAVVCTLTAKNVAPTAKAVEVAPKLATRSEAFNP